MHISPDEAYVREHVRRGSRLLNSCIWWIKQIRRHGAAPDAAVHVASSVSEHALQTSGRGFHAGHAGALLDALPAGPCLGTAAMLLHTLGYLLVLGLSAVVVYEHVGLRLLRSHWINHGLVWIAALVLTGMFTLVM